MSKPVCPRCKGNNAAIIDYRCNYSAFNGYHCTASDYTAVVCTDCGWPWRTKAKYVSYLKDTTYEEVHKAIQARAAVAHVEVPGPGRTTLDIRATDLPARSTMCRRSHSKGSSVCGEEIMPSGARAS